MSAPGERVSASPGHAIYVMRDTHWHCICGGDFINCYLALHHLFTVSEEAKT